MSAGRAELLGGDACARTSTTLYSYRLQFSARHEWRRGCSGGGAVSTGCYHRPGCTVVVSVECGWVSVGLRCECAMLCYTTPHVHSNRTNPQPQRPTCSIGVPAQTEQSGLLRSHSNEQAPFSLTPPLMHSPLTTQERPRQRHPSCIYTRVPAREYRSCPCLRHS